MNPENLHIINCRPVSALATAIDNWLAARGEYIKQASDEEQNAYNAAYFALGEAWAELYAEGADVPNGLEGFQCGLISPKMDE